jgi:hypothetical protein
MSVLVIVFLFLFFVCLAHRKSMSALPAKRLWTYLVNDEQSQGIFIKYIFKRKPLISSTPATTTLVPKVCMTIDVFGFLQRMFVFHTARKR